MQELVDGDWASNYGGWQWVAGTAPDPNGNFRVFNPVAQQRRYDPDLAYCRRWIPELDTAAYPRPMVDHARASEEFIRRFQKAYGPAPQRRRTPSRIPQNWGRGQQQETRHGRRHSRAKIARPADAQAVLSNPKTGCG